jgi:hypothetical protein
VCAHFCTFDATLDSIQNLMMAGGGEQVGDCRSGDLLPWFAMLTPIAVDVQIRPGLSIDDVADGAIRSKLSLLPPAGIDAVPRATSPSTVVLAEIP